MSSSLKSYLQSFNLLTEQEIEDFLNRLKPKHLKKGEYFIQEGKICSSLAFITRGCFRSFYYSTAEEEVTYCFTFENHFATAYSSFITQKPTTENMQAITDVDLLTISRKDIKHLEETSRNWLLLFKILAEDEYVKMEERIFLLQRESAEIRYSHLLKNNPDYLQRIPLQHLASYLGITQRHLSRIRKSIFN